MKILFHNHFHKFVKQIKNSNLSEMVKTEIDFIVNNPTRGKILEHPFRKYKIRCVSFNFKNNLYRIAYIFNSKLVELAFLVIDSRENFYAKLNRIF